MAKRTKSTLSDSTPTMTATGSAGYQTLNDAPVEHTSPGGSNGAEGDNRERIAARAYELYLQRGGEPGRETEDWLEAERELRGSSQQAGRPSVGE
jgi:hypothetical protein